MTRTLLSLFKDNRYLTVSIIVTCVFIAAAFQSRSFLLGYSISLIVFLIVLFPDFQLKKYKLSLISLFILFFYSIVFLIKTDSSLGRLLIYKISFNLLSSSYLTGVGLGNFAAKYGEYQIKYFEQGHYTTKELLLADNTTHAFNDYLEFFIQTGLPGLIALLIVGFLIYQACYRSLKLNAKKPLILTIAITQIITIACSALFNHVFEKIQWQCLFLLSLAVVIHYSHLFSLKQLLSTTFVLALIVLNSTYGNEIIYRKEYQVMNQAKEFLNAGYIKESVKLFRSVYPTLQHDPIFLNEYVVSLLTARKYAEAEQILLILIKTENNSFNYDKLAQCYFYNGNFKAAESNYLKAIYRVPNRFTSRFNLYNFYRSINHLPAANAIRNQILKLPVKVESVMIDRIKQTIKIIPNH